MFDMESKGCMDMNSNLEKLGEMKVIPETT